MKSALIILLLATGPRIGFTADSSTYQAATGDLLLQGNVSVTRQETDRDSALTLLADTIAGRIEGEIMATGRVRARSGEMAMDATRAVYDVPSGTGWFENAFAVRDSWYVRARRLAMTGENRYEIVDCSFTACDRDSPHYHFRIGRTTYADYRLRLYGARMYIGRVPVLWLPYLALRPGGRPPFRIRAGKSAYEGYFVKMGYTYDLGRLGDGELKLDWRSHRGWAYGIDHTTTLREGRLRTDLYRIDERDRGGRGAAHVEYEQVFRERWRALADYYYVTDGNFMQDYRFPEMLRRPDPAATGSLTYRAPASAFLIRVAANPNRGHYDLIERLPELRVALMPRPLLPRLYVEASGGITAFRHSHPNESGLVALNNRTRPDLARLVTVVRTDASVSLKRPIPLYGGWMMTPYTGVDFVGNLDDTFTSHSTYRVMPVLGVLFTNFARVRLSDELSWSIRPQFDLSDRSLAHENEPTRTIIEHIDQRRDQRPLRIVLDQGMHAWRDGKWVERFRLRLDGGIDFDRVGSQRYLPLTAKAVSWFGDHLSLDGSLTFDPNRETLRDARLDASWNSERVTATTGYYLRSGDAGLRDYENVNGSLAWRMGSAWRSRVGASYDLELRRLDYALYGLERDFHCWVLGLEVMDQRAWNRWDVRVTAELKFP